MLSHSLLIGWTQQRPGNMPRARPEDKSLLDDPTFSHPIFPEGPLPEGWVENLAEWHQTVGLAVILKRCFSATPTPRPVATVATDEVGLGKTLISFLLVATLTSIIDACAQGKPLPPLLSLYPLLLCPIA